MMMKRKLAAAAVLAMMAATALVACGGDSDSTPTTAAPPTAAAAFTAKIIGFNDYHGTLESPGTFGQTTAVPAASRPPVGGADFMAAQVASLK